MYVKLIAPDQLLLFESVCCELGIVSYHPSVLSVLECHSAENSEPSTSNIGCKINALPINDSF